MVPYFPKQIALRAIIIYLVSLAVVSVVFFDYAMKIGFYALGITFVLAFFLLTTNWSRSWRDIPGKEYIYYLAITAFMIRIVWVIASYFYYIDATGTPFEFDAADSVAYHLDAEWMAGENWSTTRDYLFGNTIMLADSGYPLYLSIIYRLFGPSVFIARVIKAVLSSVTCILTYKLASRTFGEGTGRIAGIMMVLMPNLIIYCGYHLKETEMLFLEVAFLERLDYIIRNKRISVINIVLPTVLAGSLFLFRTVLGAVAVFSFISTVVLSSTPTMKRNGKRLALICWGALAIALLGGGAVSAEIEEMWEEKDTSAINKREEQNLRGNNWAKYATGSVMAPMAFVLPYATMINVDQQYNQQEKSGGNYVRNFMGFFAFLAVYECIRRRRIRDFTMIGSFVVAYLGIVSLSGFSNSERFLLPGLPCLIMMWAYGISTLRERTYKLLTPWCFIVLIMEVGWAYFKLGSRGLF